MKIYFILDLLIQWPLHHEWTVFLMNITKRTLLAAILNALANTDIANPKVIPWDDFIIALN